MAPGVLRVGLLLVVVSLGIMCVGQISELQGSWKAEFKDSLGAGTASLILTASDTKDLAGSYRTNLGGEGTVAVRAQGNGYKFILTQTTKDCTGSFIGEFGFANGKITGTYSGTDCKGWHDNGAISMMRGNDSSSSKSLSPKKMIKDPVEYKAYVGAVPQQDPAAKISGLEAFLTQYPNSGDEGRCAGITDGNLPAD